MPAAPFGHSGTKRFQVLRADRLPVAVEDSLDSAQSLPPHVSHERTLSDIYPPGSERRRANIEPAARLPSRLSPIIRPHYNARIHQSGSRCSAPNRCDSDHETPMVFAMKVVTRSVIQGVTGLG